MSLGMIGIISIQFFWIRNAIDLRRVEFKRSVMSAMNDVTHKLQKEQARKKIERINQFKSFVEIDSSGIVQLTYDDEIQEMIFIEGSDSIVEMHFRIDDEGDFKRDVQLSTVWTKSGILNTDDSLNVLVELYQSNFDEKVVLYEQLLHEINEFDLSGAIIDRVDKELLKESLNEAFASRGLGYDFEFGVLSFRNLEENEFFDNEDEDQIAKIQSSPFKVNMFPGNSFDQSFYLSVIFPNLRSDVFQSLGLLLSVSALFIIIVIGVFIVIIRTVLRQKKLSEIKNDFISNMTHELKTPISTISLACEALEDKSIILAKDRQDVYINIIHNENARLGVLVEKVLRNSILDKGELNLKKERIDLNQIIEDLDQFDLHIRKNGGILTKDLSDKPPIIIVDQMHLINVISNLVDNAIKYSTDSPQITIRTKLEKEWAVLEVEDQGRGISKDHLQKIFDKFFRVPTGNVHNVKGFGLGLSYVWDIVNRMHGVVDVKSEINKGSKFTIKLPISYE
jgi:two-component system phosphate regulon sensor histidine kinase PhoR